MSNLELNKNVEWALSENARCAVTMMVEYGMDADLALAILERVWPEREIYNLPDESED